MKFLFMILFLSGCSFFLGGKESPKTAKGSRYEINFLSPHWIIKTDQGPDYIFEHATDGRIFLSNSFCNEFQGPSLEQLSLKSFSSLKNFNVTSSNYSSFHQRESYVLEGSGLMDGVKVSVKLLNTRRDNCYFDFLSISPQDSPNDDDFELFLNTVKFK